LTEKLRAKYIDSRALSRFIRELLDLVKDRVRETLPPTLMRAKKFLPKKEALLNIHFPVNHELLRQATERLKFEELFDVQLRLLKMKLVRQEKFRGQIFKDTALITRFYHEHLPFTLTEAQKKVIREIYADLKSGQQMNRLLQGDVGSGKTV